jgi:DNA-binding transcriptional regulator LsrR (DeoR family)
MKLISIQRGAPKDIRMGILSNERLVIKICQMYYEENLSQKTISQMLFVSRPQISRMLAYARDAGIVTIRVNNPYAEEDQLERALVKIYKLRTVQVVNTFSKEEYEAREIIGQNAGNRVASYLSCHKTIGIMSGKSVFHVINSALVAHDHHLVFVSLVGGMGSAGAEWHANYMAQSLAEKTGGKAYLLHAPLVMRNENAKKNLEHEEGIRHILDLAGNCEVIFAGIGQIDEGATLIESGILNQDDLAFLKQTGATAAVGAIFLNKKGQVLDNEFTRRFIGIGVKQLQACPNVVAIAFGMEKICAIDAVLRSSLIHELITNMDTARALLDIQRGSKIGCIKTHPCEFRAKTAQNGVF